MNAFMAFLYMMTIICKDEKNQAHAQGMRHHWLAGARCLSAASRRLSDRADRKSTRLNSSHLVISYAVFCLKKKTKTSTPQAPLTHRSRTRTRLHSQCASL